MKLISKIKYKKEIKKMKKQMELLIPEKILKLILLNTNIESVKELAEIFNVTKSMMIVRLDNLKLYNTGITPLKLYNETPEKIIDFIRL